ncbi:hypothetical protein VMCG_08020 [Cytospora schulzeri]|uniref:Uncharacterized protein n=1 Tax=Cytospora schulzeri TaxID=448051 RepID=A0A423VY92_9PEZI|nr:hypothetical protein VMCG_08020 [Valsa malicola]
MAGETPKRRGRPPSKPKEVNSQELHTVQPSKRRGRPPNKSKENDEQQQTTAQPAKRRGRPPKPKQGDDDVQQGSAAPKRGRGRPPKAKKEGVAASVSTGKAKSTKAGTKTATSTTKAAPKPRGRPRKSEPGAAKADQTTKASTKTSSIVGGYAITCEAISGEWPDKGEDFDLNISESSTPGIYEASFDFGILEGAMVLCSDEAVLEEYVDKLEADGYNGYDDDVDEDHDEDETTVTGGKRKAANTARGRPAKKVKKAASPGLKFHILWRGRDTSEGEVQFEPKHGTIKFTNKNYTKFIGEIDLPFVGEDVEFTGEKISNQSNGGRSSWNDYSEAEYERANTNRWG